MTTIRHCEYEILSPQDEPPLEADPGGLLHPDESITAAAVTEARSYNPLRRFVFYTAYDNPRYGRRMVSVNYQGFVANDGSVVLLQGNHPIGWYRSVVSAWRRIRCENTIWLAWLQPDPSDVPMAFDTQADRESRHGEPSTWYVSIPFTAFGAEDARMRASDITGHLETCVPGLDRLDVTFGHGDDPESENHVFCDQPGCLREPGHTSEHHIPRKPFPVIVDEPEPSGSDDGDSQ